MSTKINVINCNSNLKIPLLLQNNLDYRNIIAKMSIGDTSPILQKIKSHIELRFEELEFYLQANGLLIVTIAGSRSHGHALGVGIARYNWQNSIGHEAYNNLNQFITGKVSKLMNDFPGRVKLGFIGNRNLLKQRNGTNSVPRMNTAQIQNVPQINKNSIHVWGANESNWNLNLNTLVSGGGQAYVIGKQIPGNFGIVTMPNSNLEKLFSPTKTIHI